jgi:hypothetical protein
MDGRQRGAELTIDEQGYGTVTEQRLYQLISNSSPSPIDGSDRVSLGRAWSFCFHSADPRYA